MIRASKILAAAVVVVVFAFASPALSLDFAWDDSPPLALDTRTVALGSFDFAWSDSAALVVDTRSSAGFGDSNLFTLDTLAGIPTLSQWGLGILTLGVLAAGTIVFRRVRRDGRAPV